MYHPPSRARPRCDSWVHDRAECALMTTGGWHRYRQGGQCRRRHPGAAHAAGACCAVSALQIFKEAQELLPGGVNSPVRAFRSVGGQPIVFDHVKVRGTPALAMHRAVSARVQRMLCCRPHPAVLGAQQHNLHCDGPLPAGRILLGC